ncbi:tryptophan synthase subunit alpha [Streptomyces sp. NBC_00687]|uniref:tryptophan synthase subunit alpha n=1 Tax=Streptomyces sp. NBC_00687 TaxID=2975807 RepID=UPI002250DE76|nr:tryptophan synthase subunit alpha [Streptomyces sp. NBC_00687]MCX4919996.1 tryptophan synthase subunit alpha [Streptomyces sp. NBC_00687]
MNHPSHLQVTAPASPLPWWPPSTPVGGSLERVIEAAQAQDRCALAAFLPVCFPDRITGMDALHLLAQSADVVELGVPYAGGVLDGPVIQEASRTALAAGFEMKDLFADAREVSASSSAALLVMSYWQPVHAYGPQKFAEQAAAAGIAGVLIPDLPFEEAGPWRAAAQNAGVAVIPLVSPRTSPDRLAAIVAAATGMVYAPATDGVTGNAQPISPQLPSFVAQLRSLTSLPVAAGIGISTPAQARHAAAWADLVVVGSAVIRRMQANPRAQVAAAAAAAREFAAALRPAAQPETD